MIAKDYQEVYEAVIEMQLQLMELGVREPKTCGNLTQPAEAFAEAIMLECSRERVMQLARDESEQASAFVAILGDVHAELSVVCHAPNSSAGEVARGNMVAAEAVLYALKSRRRRNEGYSGGYLSYPKDD